MSLIVNKRPSAGDFHVKATVAAFTLTHLKTHLGIFNKKNYPDYFTDFEHKGLTYVDTRLVESILLEKANLSADFYKQKYRATKNPKFSKIQSSVEIEGVDLRKKPLQAVVELDNNNKIIKVLYLFNGNTFNEVLDNTNIQNRICAIYTQNSNFSIPNLIEIGTNQNSLEKEFSPNNDLTLEHSLREIIEAKGYPLRKSATADEISEWNTKLKASLTYMGNNYDMESAKANRIINDIMNEQLDSKYAITITSGAQALELMREDGYIDTPTVKYGCIGSFPKGVYPHFQTVYAKFSDPNKKGTPEYFDFSRGRYEVAIHLGAPDMSDPIKWFFDTTITFWNRWRDLNNFVNPTFTNNADMIIIGAYQPLDCLKHIWPVKSIIPFEEIKDYRENNKGNLGAISSTAEDNDDITEEELFIFTNPNQLELPFAKLN